jgi:hypothetical protein
MRSIPRALLIAVLSLSAGCSLPNLKPFATATQELRESVRETQLQVQGNLNALARQDAQFKPFAGEFAETWQIRLDLLDALLDYSASLAALAEAGQEGKAAAAALGDSLGRLADAAGQAGIIARTAIDVGGIVYNVIATVRAAGAIEDAVLAADPAIQDIAANLDKDFEAIAKKVQSRAVLVAAESYLQERYEKERGVNKAYRNALVKRLQALQDEVVQAQSAVPPNNGSMAALQSSIAQLEPLIRAANEQLDARARDYAAVERNWEAGQALFAGARAGFRRWALLHRQLATSLKNGAAPNVALLATTVQDLRAVLEEVRKK